MSSSLSLEAVASGAHVCCASATGMFVTLQQPECLAHAHPGSPSPRSPDPELPEVRAAGRPTGRGIGHGSGWRASQQSMAELRGHGPLTLGVLGIQFHQLPAQLSGGTSGPLGDQCPASGPCRAATSPAPRVHMGPWKPGRSHGKRTLGPPCPAGPQEAWQKPSGVAAGLGPTALPLLWVLPSCNGVRREG